VLDAATAEYQPVLTSEQRLRGEDLTLAHLESAMNQHWQQVKSSKTHDDDDTEISLITFGGTCFLCDKTGHKANTCPMKKTNRGNSNLNNGNGNGDNNGEHKNNKGNGQKRFDGYCENVANMVTTKNIVGTTRKTRTNVQNGINLRMKRQNKPNSQILLLIIPMWNSCCAV
jgi:hypothetical protein